VPWDALVEVIKAAGILAHPDGGNFPDPASRAAGLAAMYRITAGNSRIQLMPAKYDAAEAIRISKESGYQGLYTIETVPGNGADPYAAVQSVLNAVLANI
jgi:hypothetical protein